MDYKTANYLIDCIMPRVDGNEFKIAAAIARLTIGWRRQYETISLSGFQRVTGIQSVNTIRKGLDNLIAAGFVSRRPAGQSFEYALVIPEGSTLSNIDKGTMSKVDRVPYQNLTGENGETLSTFDNHSNKKEKKNGKRIYSKPFSRRSHMRPDEIETLIESGVIQR